ncbi:hypothetical protein BaRGS_00010874, partial [Batillaria attramentaria]
MALKSTPLGVNLQRTVPHGPNGQLCRYVPSAATRLFAMKQGVTRTLCTGLNVTNSKKHCCNHHLCNTNKEGVSPDEYTPPPPTTTTPLPLAATAEVANTTVNFMSMSQRNETIELICNIGGFPEPNITWFFTPDAASGAAVIAGSHNETKQSNTRDDVLLECDADGTPPVNVSWITPPVMSLFRAFGFLFR